MAGYVYIAFYKPYDVLSQFTKEIPTHRTLADYLNVPSDVYPVGRLDRDSEGLLLLTNDKSVNHQMLNPKHAHPRTYYVQLDGDITDEALEEVRAGVTIKHNKKPYNTKRCQAQRIDTPDLPERTPPIRYRANIPTSWASITLIEGKNRQVRQMFAKVGFPVLRLVRWSIDQIELENMNIGDWREIHKPRT